MKGRIEAGRVIERYVVEGPIGEGGMATVYLLRHKHLDTQFALKVLTTVGVNAELRLMLEGRVQAALRHPNIVAVTDVLDIDGAPGLLMEYVPPPTLSAWLAMHHPTLEEAEALFRGVVDGVRHAHRYGLVHRDLKPSNVLLARYDDGVVPKVSDFGLAKILGDDPAAGQTRSGLTMGTPQYMAPEQFRDAKKVDRRADIFSLGCILYELVSGRPPYQWTDFIHLYNQIMAKDFPPLAGEVPERLRRVVDACLEPEREARPGDCDALLAMLDGRELPTSPTVSPENLGRLVEMPLLRDRVGMTVPLGSRPALPRPAAIDDLTVIGEGAIPRTEVAERSPPPPTLAKPASPAASATMVPTDSLAPRAAPAGDSVAPEESLAPLPSPVARPAAKRAGVPAAAIVAGVLAAAALSVVAIGIVATQIDWTGPVEVATPAEPVAEALPPVTPADPAVEVPPPGAEPVPVGDEPPAPVKPARGVSRPPPEIAVVTTPPAAVPAPSKVEAPVPEPTVAVTPVAPVVTAPSTATASVSGDAERVVVTMGSTRVDLPAELAPGTYSILAWFPDMPSTKAGSLTVAAGDSVTVKCTAAFLQCTTR
ncbi:MAG: protein kinase [Deltaproteobacteria bacterium]|nr:protein kinase [Deltaproteobacteria bacterium]